MVRLNTLVLGAAALSTVVLAGCGTGSMPHGMNNGTNFNHAGFSDQSPAYYAWWDQQMVLHRDSNVYFDPFSSNFYWFARDEWKSGDTLPRSFGLSRDNRDVVKRSHLLMRSGQAQYVMSFNPYYEEPFDPLIEAADALLDYDAFENNFENFETFGSVESDESVDADASAQVTESGSEND